MERCLKGANLVKNSGMQLKEVDIDKAIDANHQLSHPSVAPDSREAFFAAIDLIKKTYDEGEFYYERYYFSAV